MPPQAMPSHTEMSLMTTVLYRLVCNSTVLLPKSPALYFRTELSFVKPNIFCRAWGPERKSCYDNTIRRIF